jgi:flagellar biosynthesis/type III secretory pathway protein FliH
MPDTEETALTQQTYKTTEYSDQSWEVIGQVPETQVFAPMQIEILPNTELRSDPMFADYGGGMHEGAGQASDNRWHLPDAIRQGAKKKPGEDEEEEEKTYTEEEVQLLVSDAEERGRIKALEEAIELQNEKLAKIENSMNTILQDLHKQFVESIAMIEKEALNLSLSISEKLLHHTVEINPDYITKIINEAISLCGSATVKKIRVSPQDMEFIEIVGIARQLIQTDPGWHFEADSGIRAGCVIETSGGEVDYQLDEAFSRIKENVAKVIK